MTNMVTTTYECTVWRAIRNLWPLMQTRTRFKVGKRQRVSLQNDKWVGNDLLSRLYSNIYSLCQTKQATIAEVRNGQAWNLYFRRYLYDWEMETIASFYANLADFTSSVEKVDRLEWQKDKSGKFTVNSTYKDLNISEFQEKDWPWKMIWKIKISYKVNRFTWLLAKEAVLTHENLNKRGFHLWS